MRLPAGHARRLFLGFTCSIMFLVVFALLIAHNTEAESSSFGGPSVENYPLTIGIPTGQPERTIEFYQKLGFKAVEGLPRGFDIVCMEKEGTPYKLEICHNRFSETLPPAGAVSGMTFPVQELSDSVKELQRKGLRFVETHGRSDGVTYASLKDPNGIRIKLFQQ